MVGEVNSEAAYTLFPNDAPPDKVPDWYEARRDAAEVRLSGTHSADAGSEQNRSAGNDGADDAATTLFKNDAVKFDPAPVKDFMSGFAQSAIADGAIDRAQALEAAGEALVTNFSQAGTSAAEVHEALDIVRERQGDTMTGPVSAEKAQAEFSETMATLSAEGVTQSDIGLAQAFIHDLEVVAPGTIASLEATGAGNDPRLIRKAIAEAKRRGYAR